MGQISRQPGILELDRKEECSRDIDPLDVNTRLRAGTRIDFVLPERITGRIGFAVGATVSLSAIVTSAVLGLPRPAPAPVTLLKYKLIVSSFSSKLSLTINMVNVLLVSPGAKLSVP